MTELLEVTRHAYTFFCDDVRREDSGKLLFIGVYGAAMYVESFPFDIRGLAFVISVVTPVSRPFKQLGLQVLRDDEELVSTEFKEEQLAQMAEQAEAANDGSPDRVTKLQIILHSPPIHFEGPGHIRVRVVTEDGTIPAGALRVEQHPNQQGEDSPGS
ncbi:hypothetical protein H0Z60_04935 [Ectothiorhodospiraceae bacterium WFHF3C12]|nr:hypothetical protein [Ectothiorhodospiraceae bacterium WFHF3C12]